MIQILGIDPFGWIDPISWIGDILKLIGKTCCSVIFVVGAVVAMVLFLYFKKKKSL